MVVGSQEMPEKNWKQSQVKKWSPKKITCREKQQRSCRKNKTGHSTWPGAGVSALEREIDELVYALYGLTPEEINRVEETDEEIVVVMLYKTSKFEKYEGGP